MSYRPVRKQRYIYRGKRYDEVTWNDLSEVVEAFHRKIKEWYIIPADGILKAGFDQAFALMAMTCLLTDALSQYYFGKTKSSQPTFKDFVKLAVPRFADKLPKAIDFTDPYGKRKQLVDYADVLYVGFRCGILHECHVPLYGGLAGQDQLKGEMLDVDPEICTRYDDGTDCPTVRMDPTLIYPAVKAMFEQYVSDLRDPDSKFDNLRRDFKIKFFASFGEDLTNSAL